MSGNPKAKEKTVNAKAFHDLQQAEAKYRSTFENAAQGIFQSTPGGRYLSVNPAMARIYGYETPEEMMEVVADIARQVYADPEMRREFVLRLKKEGKIEKFELRALRKDGSLIWTSTNARIVRDAKGKVLFYEGFVQDITERKRAEEALRKKDEHHRKVVESIFRFVPEGLLVFTKNLSLVEQNKAFEEITQQYAARLGYTEQELADLIADQVRSRLLSGDATEIHISKKRG